EGEKRFDMVVRLSPESRTEMTDVSDLFIPISNGSQVPLSAVANIELKDAPMQISRDNTNRRIVIGVNVGNTDVETLVEKIEKAIDENITLPSGYYFTYGGQFENLKEANARLSIAVPIALALIFILLFFTFGSVKQAALIFTAIPLSAIGGIWALQLRGMPFSISAGIGFIALFGVAVLNGIVLIGYFNQLKKEGVTNLQERILKGTSVRLRPVLMTAAVASMGFLPMAISSSGGAEVQRPLATVVIGGLISATILTLLVLPILYSWVETWEDNKIKVNKTTLSLLLLAFMSIGSVQAQQTLSLEEAVSMALKNHPNIKASDLAIEKNQKLSTLKYNLGKTELTYQGDGFMDKQYGQLVNQIGVVQNIPNPAVVKSQNTLNKQVHLQSIVNKAISEAELTMQVKQQYYSIQYKKEMESLYNKLIGLYTEYLQKADTRHQVGAANSLEKLNIQSKLQEYEMLKKQVILDLASQEKQLTLLLNTTDTVIIADTLSKADWTPANDNNNLWIEQAQLQTAIEEAGIKVAKSTMIPDFSVGYAAQNYMQGGWLSGVQAGMSFSMFNGNTRKKIQAQKIQFQVAETQKEAIALNVRQQMLDAIKTIEVYETGINFYHHQLQQINPEIQRVVQLNYNAGGLTYLELLNVLNLLSQNESNYLTQLYEYNKAVAYYQYLSNEKQ
ncbi:MAG: CusA/CzcA family heavy metal efflux RND transporter, partial [Bacteroidetes bacterium]|nr:CusA/CzcA family heavy metal efflux RND transporter [Bacteroidota bacterium]